MKRIILTILCANSLAQTQAQTPTPCYSGSTPYEPIGLITFNNKLYFTGNSTIGGMELWSYAGTGAATQVADLYPSTGNGTLGIGFARPHMAVFQNKLYFSGNNGNTGREPFIYDGVNPPVLFDQRPGIWGSDPRNFTTYGGKLYFTMSSKIDSNLTSLYSYNGTGVPVELKSVYQKDPDNLIPYKGKMYFTAWTSLQGTELFAYDTASNTVALVKDISLTSSSQPLNLIEANGKLYFTAREDNYGNELFSYDGTTMTRLTDIAPGALSGVYYGGFTGLAYFNNALYFGGAVDAQSYQLYKYDLSTNTPSLVHTIWAGQNSGPSEFMVFNNKLYFNATDNVAGSELWVTDGTTTSMVADIDPGAYNGLPEGLFVFNNDLYFGATSHGVGQVLYRLNGGGTTTGISRAGFTGSVGMAPNPSSDIAVLTLDLNASQKASVAITDASGRMVWQQAVREYPAGRTGISIPTHPLATGTYYYRLADANGAMLAAGSLVRN